MSFINTVYKVDESEHKIHVPIYRSGDSRSESSVICYTRQDSALVVVDYVERPLTEDSRVVFHTGDRVGFNVLANLNNSCIICL